MGRQMRETVNCECTLTDEEKLRAEKELAARMGKVRVATMSTKREENGGAIERIERDALLREKMMLLVRMGKTGGDTLKSAREALRGAGKGGGTVNRGGVLDNLEWALTLTRRMLGVMREMQVVLERGGEA